MVIEASGAPASPAAALTMAPPRRRRRASSGCSPHPVPDWTCSRVSTREIDVHGTLAHVCGEDLAEAVAVLASTPLADAVLGDVISLGDLVEGGLRPLAERKAHGKIVVDVAGSA